MINSRSMAVNSNPFRVPGMTISRIHYGGVVVKLLGARLWSEAAASFYDHDNLMTAHSSPGVSQRVSVGQCGVLDSVLCAKPTNLYITPASWFRAEVRLHPPSRCVGGLTTKTVMPSRRSLWRVLELGRWHVIWIVFSMRRLRSAGAVHHQRCGSVDVLKPLRIP